MSPSVKDLYEGFEVVRYECGPNSWQKFKRNYPRCSHRCPICLHMKKHILAYDYMPTGPLLASLCKSRSICERMLMTWRTKDMWLGRNPKVLPKVIKKHFDGNKFRECQAFWNPEREWEAFVICPNNKCSHFFRTFLPAQSVRNCFSIGIQIQIIISFNAQSVQLLSMSKCMLKVSLEHFC
jgi:hypothetical protein